MSKRDLMIPGVTTAAVSKGGLDDLLAKPTQQADAKVGWDGAAVGELLALLDNGRTPVVVMNGGAVAARGRTTIDLHGDDVGQQVVVLFEDGDRQRPIVVGVLRTDRTAAPPELAGDVDVSTDGERMIVNARRELVLRCGKASITLRQDGTVHIVGERILSRATGPNRVQGGSVQLN